MVTYKDLDIYKIGHALAVEVHKMTLRELPRFEMFEEGAQVRRSSKSIVVNIVEGFGRRRYKQEFIQFLTYSLASCDETRAHIELLFDTGSLEDKAIFDDFLNRYEELGARIMAFTKSVERGHLTRRHK
jgi:four helix bundle protein